MYGVTCLVSFDLLALTDKCRTPLTLDRYLGKVS